MKDKAGNDLKEILTERSYELARQALPKIRDSRKPATPYYYLKFYQESETEMDRKERDLYESQREEEVLNKAAIKECLEKYFFGIFKGKYDDQLIKVFQQTQKKQNTRELFRSVAAIINILAEVSNTQNTLKNLSERNASLKKFTSDLVQDMDQTVTRLGEGVSLKKIEEGFARDIGTNLEKTVEKGKQMEREHVEKEEGFMRLLQAQQKNFERTINDLQGKLVKSEHEVYTDALTGVNNRRAFDERVQKELEKGLSLKKPCALCIIDIDFFKKINDTFGHQIGDHALKYLTKIVQNSIKHADFLARYGGEEFAVILPNTNYDNALTAAENIRRNIDEEIFTVRGHPLDITVSIGVSELLNQNIENIQDLIQVADKALYKAKASGRNRVC